MSWIDDLRVQLFITTGDGATYKPNWLNSGKVKDYNTSEFDFINVAGTLVVKSKPKGRKITIDLFFQGLDHLDVAKEFEISCDDPRPWRLEHPYYGTLTVQPISIAFDNKDDNVTKINATLLETITEDNPKFTINAVDKITADKTTLDEISALSFANDIPAPSTKDINSLTLNLSTVYETGSKSVKETLDAQDYFDLFNKANAAVIKATSFPLEAISAVQAVINAPFLFIDSVQNRIKMMKTQFDNLRLALSTLFLKGDKKIYEDNMVALVGAISTASVTNFSYASGAEAVAVAEQIIEVYDQLIEDLDSIQSENGGSIDSYIPDAEVLTDLSNLVNFTVSNLFDIALNSRQERSFFLEQDSNVLLLTNRLLGLDITDTNIDEFININGIGLSEILEIKKDRKIIYYV